MQGEKKIDDKSQEERKRFDRRKINHNGTSTWVNHESVNDKKRFRVMIGQVMEAYKFKFCLN